MQSSLRQVVIFVFFIFVTYFNYAQNIENSEIKKPDTISKKEQKKEYKEERKVILKESRQRFRIKGTSVFANLSTTLSFQLPPHGHLSANISLEDDFGLEDKRSFFVGSFLYFITPRSGLYAQYYNIARQNVHVTEKEYTFLDHTIPVGSEITAYFNTRVFSVGYLLTILRDSNVFLGAYFNVYFMDIGSGVYTSERIIDEDINFLAPLPNFGIIANFKLYPWLSFDANLGFFSISLEDIPFGAGIYNVSVALVFKPTKWLGISTSYEMFDVNIDTAFDIESSEIPTNIEYHFKGPALGLLFSF